jgi:lysophospholipase L1-like esterase
MDARRGPGALLADWSGQDVLVVAAPGMGYTKEANNMPGATAEVFLRNIIYDTVWLQPEVEAVFVNLGSNDYNTTTAPDDLLRQKAASFLATTRAMFPKAEIYVLRPFAGVRVNVLQGVVTASGDRRIHWVDTTGWLNLATGADTSDGLHPNASGAQKYAARLMTVLDQTLVLPGDVDNDGQVTLSDAAIVAGIAAGTR